ncbi:lectin-like [Danio rerio]|uniref:Lectin-like n=1 Tax=Danio rerio TaxID=7955 RepID=A0AC58G2N3_DANRE
MRIEAIFLLISALSSCVTSHLFYFIPTVMNWTDAQTYCRQNYIDLATIGDQTDLSDTLASIPSGFTNNIWIGLYRMGADASWVFSDQNKCLFMQWMRGQPNNSGGNQYCVYTTPTGYWNDWECPDKLAFICYSEKKSQTVRLEVKSAQNVNEPGVNGEILLQLTQILRSKGLPVDAELSWKTSSAGKVFQKMWYQKSELSNTPCQRNVN